MDKRKLKDYGVLFIGLLLIVSSISLAVTRNISDTSDDVVTFIRNSNGKYWPATGANIQNAIDDLTTGGTVWLPKGTLTVSDEIEITTDNIAIKGAGIGSTIITTSAGTYSGGIIYFNGGDDTPDGDELFNVSVSDLTVKGVDGVNSVNGIAFRNGIWNGTVENVQIINPTSNGLYIDDSFNCFVNNLYVKEVSTSPYHALVVQESKYGTINNVIIENCSGGDYAVDYSFARNYTGNNWVMYDVEFGIKLDADDPASNYCWNNVFNNIIIHGNGGNAFHTGENTQYTYLNNFQFYGCNKGIDADSGCDYFFVSNGYINGGTQENDFSCDYVEINQLTIENCASNGFDLDGNHILVSNSHFIGNAGHGCKVRGSNISISNCEFLDDTGTYGALKLDGCKDVNIDSCVISNCNRGVYVVDGCTHFGITDSMIRYCTQDGVFLATGGNTDYYRIIGNEVTSNGDGIDDNAAGANNVTADNLT